MRRFLRLGVLGSCAIAVLGAIQGCTLKDGFLAFLALFLVGTMSGNDLPSGVVYATTDSSGHARIQTSLGTLQIVSQDQNGNIAADVEIHTYELGEQILVVAGREDAFPSFHLFDRQSFTQGSSVSTAVGANGVSSPQPEFAVTTILTVVVVIVLAAVDIYDYYKNPGEFPLQIPDVIEGSKKVKTTCVQVDAGDVLALGGLISAIGAPFKALQVLGAPAKLRGVKAIHLGFTMKNLLKEVAEAIGEEVADFLGLLDTDFITSCEYQYEDPSGKVDNIPVLKWDVTKGDVAESFLDEGFETGANGWTFTGQWNTVKNPELISNDYDGICVNLPGGNHLPNAFSGDSVLWFGKSSAGSFIGSNINTSTPGCHSDRTFGTAMSPAIDLTSVSAASLSFHYWFEIESVDPHAFDMMFVEAAFSGNGPWQELARLNPALDADGPATTPYTSAGLGETPSWNAQGIGLDLLAGHTIYIRFRFDSVNGNYNGFRGWLIDDVRVTKTLTF